MWHDTKDVVLMILKWCIYGWYIIGDIMCIVQGFIKCTQ